MLAIKDLSKAYTAGLPVLKDISLTIARGEIVCLLGPSGCGKTTLLRVVAGLEDADQGTLMIDGQDLTTIPVHRRHFGLMFQDFALFPHRTVAENVAFGLRMAGADHSAIAKRVQEVLALVDLASYGDRSIFELSGGERQRVALARSLAPHPRLLMLDEPLGSLDRTLRDELVTELRTILKQVDATALYVTHDQQEAFAVADRLVVMRAGRIEQIGTPQAIYQTPANTFVARFLGLSNLVPVAVNKAVSGQLQTPFGNWSLVADGENRLNHAAFDATAKLCLLIRPDAVTALDLADNTVAPTPARPTISGLLQILSFRGATYRLEIVITALPTTDPAGPAVKPGDQKRRYQLGFDLPTALVTPYLEQLVSGTTVTLMLNPAAIALVTAS